MEETSKVGTINKDTVVNVEKALAQLNKHIFTYYPSSKKVVLSRYEMECMLSLIHI